MKNFIVLHKIEGRGGNYPRKPRKERILCIGHLNWHRG